VRTWAKQHSLVFFAGFSVFVVALAYGVLAGSILNMRPLPFLLRGIGLGLMAGGLALWAADSRYEGGRPELNPLLGAMVAVGVLTLLIAAFFTRQQPLGVLVWAGVAINVFALLIGGIIMLVNPAHEKPVTVSWPEGGEPPAPEPHHDDDHHDDDAHHVEVDDQKEVVDVTPAAAVEAQTVEPITQPDDLTRIEGIGPKLNGILQAAGITTFAELAAATPEHISQIVKAADFKAPFDPASWPEQAALAASGDWEALDALQDDLQGGRR
jgi:predicted flap endonuclease-1-like 5' DNA nuclease